MVAESMEVLITIYTVYYHVGVANHTVNKGLVPDTTSRSHVVIPVLTFKRITETISR